MQRLAEAREHGIERLRLRDVARETVKDEAALGVRLGQTILDHAEHHVVGHQLAGVHRRLGALASSLPPATSARSRSPVDIWGILYFSTSSLACVPLPEPGAPKKHDTHGYSRFES